jgi:hypothetical protein
MISGLKTNYSFESMFYFGRRNAMKEVVFLYIVSTKDRRFISIIFSTVRNLSTVRTYVRTTFLSDFDGIQYLVSVSAHP